MACPHAALSKDLGSVHNPPLQAPTITGGVGMLSLQFVVGWAPILGANNIRMCLLVNCALITNELGVNQRGHENIC